ncbi:MAG: DUF1579 domain-containing protein [Acidobacteria bacterium]|nr:DUF1579 domain-containing protein [Acidobacteriota bacterium]
MAALHSSPTPQHAWLQRAAGSWYVSCAYYAAPGQPPIKVQGSETVSRVGDFWTISTFEADMMGSHIKGHATLGFDPIAQKFVGTWIDSATPHLYRFSGSLDGNRLEMSGENIDPASGKPAMYRSVEVRDGQQRSFSLHVKVGDQAEFNVLKYTYTRKP